MDDILRDINKNDIDQKLEELNSIHPSLSFTVERETIGTIPFLDMKITHMENRLESLVSAVADDLWLAFCSYVSTTYYLI